MKHVFKIHFSLLLFLLCTISMSNAQRKDPFSRKWDHTYNRLEFTKNLQASFTEKVAVSEINDAEVFLRRARRQFGNKRAIIANRSLNEANDAINKALRKLLKGPLQKQREDLNALIESAKKLVPGSGNTRARNLLKSGIENKNMAHQLFRENEFQRALKLFSQASFQIQRAIDLVKNSDQATKEQVADEKTRFNQLLSEAEPKIAASGNSTVRDNYRQAIKLTGKAELAANNVEFQQAIQYYHQATRVLLRAIDLASGNADRTALRAHEEVAALDEVIENLQSRFGRRDDNETVTFWGTRIIQLQRDAHEALENKNYKLSLMHAQLARDLIQRILKNQNNRRGGADEMLITELNQLGVEIAELKMNAKRVENTEALILLRYANTSKQRGDRFLRNGNVALARGGVFSANYFVSAVERLLRSEYTDSLSEIDVLQKIQAMQTELASVRNNVESPGKTEQLFYLDQISRLLKLADENVKLRHFIVANICADFAKVLLDRWSEFLKR